MGAKKKEAGARTGEHNGQVKRGGKRAGWKKGRKPAFSANPKCLYTSQEPRIKNRFEHRTYLKLKTKMIINIRYISIIHKYDMALTYIFAYRHAHLRSTGVSVEQGAHTTAGRFHVSHGSGLCGRIRLFGAPQDQD